MSVLSHVWLNAQGPCHCFCTDAPGSRLATMARTSLDEGFTDEKWKDREERVVETVVEESAAKEEESFFVGREGGGEGGEEEGGGEGGDAEEEVPDG